MTRFEVVNLAAIRSALDRHNSNCSEPAQAILLNPMDHGLLRWDELWGLPVRAEDRVKVRRIQIECDGATWDSEETLTDDTRERGWPEP